METARLSVEVAGELRDLIPRFLANRRVEIENLRAAVARGDPEAARRIGHTLKGVGGGYGFGEITRLGAAIEAAALAGGDGLSGLADELAEYLDRVEITFTPSADPCASPSSRTTSRRPTWCASGWSAPGTPATPSPAGASSCASWRATAST